MADEALIGIGADLTSLENALAKLPLLAGEEAEKAVRQVQRMAIKSSRMITKAIGAESRQRKIAERSTERVLSMLSKASRESMTASQRAVSSMEDELRKLKQLEAAGADAVKVEQARVATITAGAKKIAAARAQELGGPSKGATAKMAAFGKASGVAAQKTANLGYAAQSVAVQIPDVVSQLSAGTPAMQVFTQQGLQVVQVNMGLVLSAGKALAAFLTGPFIVVVAAATTAGIVLANAIGKQRQELAAFHKALKGSAKALDVAAIKGYTAAHHALERAVSDSTLALYQEQGVLDSLDITQMRAIETTRKAAKAVTLEAAAIWARMDVQRQELRDKVQGNKLNFEDRVAAVARLKLLSKEMPLARARIDQIREETMATAIKVNQTYNDIRSTREAAKAAKDAGKARSSATRAVVDEQAILLKQAQAIGKIGAKSYKKAMAALEPFLSALNAAREPFADKSETARLGKLREELVAAGNAAQLTSEQALELQAALAQIDHRIQTIGHMAATAFDPLNATLSKTGDLAGDALGDLAAGVESSMNAVPWRKIWAGSLLESAKAAAGKAAGVISALTGGALAALSDPVALLT